MLKVLNQFLKLFLWLSQFPPLKRDDFIYTSYQQTVDVIITMNGIPVYFTQLHLIRFISLN